MAQKKTTKKATTTKKAAPKKAASVKSTSTKTTTTRVKSETKKAVVSSKKTETKLPNNLINIVLAELIGTFILTLVALYLGYFMSPLYIGLTLMLLVITIGATSGAHVNPAVTFGLWSMRKLKTALVPFYWLAQILGAMAAVVLLGALSGGTFAVHFDNFMNFSWGIFAVELIGMAVFMFGIAATLDRIDIKPTGKAVGIGMSLAIGIVVAGSVLPHVQGAALAKANGGPPPAVTDQMLTLPRESYIEGATLNPAVALAITEKNESRAFEMNDATPESERLMSRMGIEVILSTLVGAALGGNLYLLIARGRN